MAIGIDTSKWKPRKLKGTPALKVANYLGSGILTFGVALGLFLQYGNFTTRMRKRFQNLYTDPVEEIQRRQMIAAGLPTSNEHIRRYVEDANKIDLSDKYKTKNGEVRSKYFVDTKDSKDDSISEFKEPKKNIKGPKAKTEQKPKIKPAKKPLKRPRNQKDIRTALKCERNDLIAYSKDFDAVCKQSGLDVDSEQLQLAIALSKSLQNCEESSNNYLTADNSKPSTSQERVRTIRKTLQEYGFKVPDVKINTANNKRGRRIRKDSKLLLITEAERQQSIANRYSQILLENFIAKKGDVTDFNSDRNSTFYHLATNISYEDIRDLNVFFVKDLLGNNTTTVIGSLLRDWSKIPGRPLSPVPKTAKVKFAEMNLNPREVDAVLSGTIVQCQELVKSKWVNIIDEDSSDVSKVQETTEETPVICNVLQIPATQVRSCSPDLFDDEFSAVENSRETFSSQKTLSQPSCRQTDSQKNIPNVTRRKTNDFMDLTECVDVFSLPHITRKKDKVSDVSNEVVSVNSVPSSPKSDDLMEITECTGPKLWLNNTNRGNSNPQIKEDLICVTEHGLSKPEYDQTGIKDKIDLTQDSDSKDNSLVNVFENKSTIMIDDRIDLTQSDYSDDDTLPLVHMRGQKLNSFNEGDYLGTDQATKGSFNKNKNQDYDLKSEVEVELGITKQIVSPKHIISLDDRNTSSSKQSSIFEEYVFEHSDHQSSKDTEAKLSYKSDTIEPVEKENEIDLTENANASTISIGDSTKPTMTYDTNNLGKKDDVSIDYDEVYMNETVENINSTQFKPPISENNVYLQDSFKVNEDHSIDYDEIQTNETVEKINITPNKKQRSEINDKEHRSSLYGASEHIESKHTLDGNNSADNYDDYIDIVNDDVHFDALVQADTSKTELSNSSKKVITPEHSQEVFEISDEELNYSMNKSKRIVNGSQESQPFILSDENDQGNFDFGGISTLDNVLDAADNTNGHKSIAVTKSGESSESDNIFPLIGLKGKMVKIKAHAESVTYEEVTPTKTNCNNPFSSVQTPNNTDYLIKTHNVTPMIDYAAMTTPDRNKELEKYGLKPFKRKRAIQLLNHLYTQTHPVVENCTSEDLASPSKKRKPENHPTSSQEPLDRPTQRSPKKSNKSPRKGRIQSPKEGRKSPRKCSKSQRKSSENSKGNNIETDVADYTETSSIPVIRHIECPPEDWVFQKREKAKVHSCRVPLHVAFHNYVSSRRCVREAILRYEPVNIDVIHRDLVASGHRYHPKDLLRFLDKKCITVKTADNNGRNKKS